MSLDEICTLYLKGRKLRKQAIELSGRNLANKFGRSEKTIAKIANGMPCNVPDDERRLILACISERDRLKSKASELSLNRLCKQNGVSHHTVLQQLERMGEREVAA